MRRFFGVVILVGVFVMVVSLTAQIVGWAFALGAWGVSVATALLIAAGIILLVK